MKNNKFGGETITTGEASERVTALDGARVRVLEDGETGTIYLVYINRVTQAVQIWVNMDGRGARCFRPQSLVCLDGKQLIEVHP